MKYLPLLAIILFFATCKKKPDSPEPEPEPTPAPTSGNISGKVTRLDQFGKQYANGFANVLVSLQGTTIQSSTDTSGHYTLQNVSAGTYTISFSNGDVGATKIQSIIYKVGDNVLYNAVMADLPTFSVNSAYVKDTAWFNTNIPGIYYRAYASTSNTNAATVAIIGKSANLSIGVPGSYDNFAPVSVVGNVSDYNRFLGYTFMKDSYGYLSGDTIYIKIYPVAKESAGYTDPKLSKTVYTAHGNAFVPSFSLTLP